MRNPDGLWRCCARRNRLITITTPAPSSPYPKGATGIPVGSRMPADVVRAEFCSRRGVAPSSLLPAGELGLAPDPLALFALEAGTRFLPPFRARLSVTESVVTMPGAVVGFDAFRPTIGGRASNTIR